MAIADYEAVSTAMTPYEWACMVVKRCHDTSAGLVFYSADGGDWFAPMFRRAMDDLGRFVPSVERKGKRPGKWS